MSAGGSTHGSSSTPHSMARPHRLSSMEYGLALVVGTGMPRSLGVVHLLLARLELPLAHRSEHLEVGIERCDAHLEAHLVVALAGAAVRDVLRLVAVRLFDEVLDDDRPAHRREERVLVLVERVGRSALARNSSTYSSRTSLTMDSTAPIVSAFWRTNSRSWRSWPDVDRERDDVDVVVLLQPLDGDRGVQTAGVCKYDLLPSHAIVPSRVGRLAASAAPRAVVQRSSTGVERECPLDDPSELVERVDEQRRVVFARR